MARRWISLTLVIVMSGCGNPSSHPANENRDAAEVVGNQLPGPDPADPDNLKPGQKGPLPDDRTPVAEGPIDPTSAQGAGLVLQQYAGLLEQRKFAEARRLWSDEGRASNLTEQEFADSFASYAEIHSEIGAPGETEGAAGSIFVAIPLRLYGKTVAGKPFNLTGTAALRRVNDVPGSTAEQRQWHIHSIDMKSSG